MFDPLSILVGVIAATIVLGIFFFLNKHLTEKHEHEENLRYAQREVEHAQREQQRRATQSLNVGRRMFKEIVNKTANLASEFEILVHKREDKKLGRIYLQVHRPDHGSIRTGVPIMDVSVDYKDSDFPPIMVHHGAYGRTVWLSGEDWGIDEAIDYILEYMNKEASELRSKRQLV